jgi:DNA-binding transcriptional MerR regulator
MERRQKLYYKIGEACRVLDIQPYVLRYWETEFPILAPTKSKSGQRVYAELELGIIRRIKELLYDEGYTIAGAKKKLETELVNVPVEPAVAAPPRSKRAVAVRDSVSEPSESGNLILPLDTSDSQRIERWRQGIRAALTEARTILDLLDSTEQRAGR